MYKPCRVNSIACEVGCLHELRTKFRLGGTYRGIHGVLGGPIMGYTRNLVQGSHRGFGGFSALLVRKWFGPRLYLEGQGDLVSNGL